MDCACVDGFFFVLFLRPCEEPCGRGLSIGNIRGKYDMWNEVKEKCGHLIITVILMLVRIKQNCRK